MRAVIDTNVFVSSFFGGKPRAVLRLWHEGRFTLCVSADIVEEYATVLGRMGLGPGGELATLLGKVTTGPNVVFATDPPAVRLVEADPDDDKFVACALAVGARYIVSGDRHLLALRSVPPVEILPPARFLELFR